MNIPAKNNTIVSAAKVALKAASLYLTSKKMSDVKLAGYYVTHNDRYMVFDTGADALCGQIRCISKSVRENKMFISFYSLPSIDKASRGEYIFPVNLPLECDEIYMYSGDEGYQLTLKKNKLHNIWVKA